jgi:hypothetical protein
MRILPCDGVGMSAHVYHGDLPGYDERQILFDGCPECERRGEDPRLALSHMDVLTTRRALARAIEWQTGSVDSAYLAISDAEARTLETLWIVAIGMARAGLASFVGVRV